MTLLELQKIEYSLVFLTQEGTFFSRERVWRTRPYCYCAYPGV